MHEILKCATTCALIPVALAALYVIGLIVTGIVSTVHDMVVLPPFRKLVEARGWDWEDHHSAYYYQIGGAIGEIRWHLRAVTADMYVRVAPGQKPPPPGRFEFRWWAEPITFPRHIVLIGPHWSFKPDPDDPYVRLSHLHHLAKSVSLPTEEVEPYFERLQPYAAGSEAFRSRYGIATTSKGLARRIATAPFTHRLTEIRERLGLERQEITYWWGGIKWTCDAHYIERDIDKIAALIETGLKLIESIQGIEAGPDKTAAPPQK